MVLIQNLSYSLYFIYFLIKSFIPIKSEMKIFPDHISSGDPIFNTSQVYSATNERFIYKLGYYTSSTLTNPPNIYSKKYGIYYEPVTCTTGTSTSTGFVDKAKVIEQKDSTKNNKGKNYFEEVELFNNVITGNNIECDSHLKIIHSKNLVLTYTIPVISSGTSFTLDIKTQEGDVKEICNVVLTPNELKMIKIDIKTDQENSLGGNVRMTFKCTDSPNQVYISSAGNGYFTFIYNKAITNQISISNFRIVVEDTSIKTGAKPEPNKNLIRGTNGLAYPNSCFNSYTDKECFRGFLCSVNDCKQCHFSCAKCSLDKSQATARSACTKCSPLTLNDEQEPVDGACPINFIDLSQFKDINIDIYPYGEEFNERATIGYWIFFSDLTGARSLENDIYHVVLKNRIIISLVPGDDKITAYCHAFEDLYRKVTSETKLYSYYSDKNSEYVVSQVIPSSNQKNGLEYETMNGKWFHISCGISFDHRKLYLKSVVNGINSIEAKSLPVEKLYPGSGVNDDGENDFYFSHIINKGAPLTLSIKNLEILMLKYI